ncbi:MAG: UDP-N-acetylglucosamine transferase subunit ALG14 [Gammaproteobacteria bacterium]|nr:UDP-N-acetylglucosamine transferase subunit ALG14 [Gammaproteobacteria bacterium]
METPPVKLCMACSSGGHLLQFVQLRDWWSEYQRFWVTFDKPDARSILADETVYWGHHPTTRSLWNLIRNAFLAVKLLWRERPDVIVSSGAAIAVPFFYVGKLFGAKTIFIEGISRVGSPTLSGRMVRPVTDEFYVQWPQQLEYFRGSKLLGRLI